MNWKGVLPAITTNLHADLSVDHAALAAHCRWMIDNGCTGIVAGGSLGEAATLSFAEKIAIVETCVKAVGERAPVVLGIASLSTAEAVALARAAAQAGAQGLMVLPPYVYASDWREMRRTSAPSSRRPNCPACSTTTRLPTKPTSCRNRSPSWPRCIRICRRSRSPAVTSAA